MLSLSLLLQLLHQYITTCHNCSLIKSFCRAQAAGQPQPTESSYHHHHPLYHHPARIPLILISAAAPHARLPFMFLSILTHVARCTLHAALNSLSLFLSSISLIYEIWQLYIMVASVVFAISKWQLKLVWRKTH